MDVKKLFESLRAKAAQQGIEDLELYAQRKQEFNIKTFHQEIDRYQVSENGGMSIRGMVDGKIGYFYTERMDDDAEVILAGIKENAQAIEVMEETITGRPFSVRDLDGFDGSLESISPEEKVTTLLAVEKKLAEKAPQMKDVPYNMYVDVVTENTLMNTKGLDLYEKTNLFYMVYSAVVTDGKKNKTSYKIHAGRKLKDVDHDHYIEGVVQEALDQLVAEKPNSGTYKMILRNDVATSLLEGFSGLFSAEAVDKGISLFKGKIGERIGSEAFTLLDAPQHEKALLRRSFDDEGNPTKEKRVVDKGILTTYLHNEKTANKMGTSPTGNGYRSSFKSAVGISPSNFFIQPDQWTYHELVQQMETGVIITNIQALHSGLNAISGDFSLPAQGYLVEKGKIAKSIDGFTISGNIVDLLMGITAVGSDLFVEVPGGLGSMGSPSLLVDKISIAGA